MSQVRDWKSMKEMFVRLLVERTGEGLEVWNRRVQEQDFQDEKSLRDWLAEQGVTGYAQMLLVMEKFGYPAYFLASSDELVDRQYADRPNLRPIYEAILEAVSGLGELTIQARQTYVSLVTPRRTFARVQPTTKTRVDLGLRLDGYEPGGRLRPSKIQETMRLQISLTSVEEVDAEVLEWLQLAYDQNST